jgi:hypothetical protein
VTSDDTADLYAAAVLGVLLAQFPAELADPHVQDVVRRHVARQWRDPQATFEVIIDNPVAARWRLKPNHVLPSPGQGFVRLAHYGADTIARQRIVSAVNTALALINVGRPPVVRCTGLTAQWCPVHGSCRCPDREQAMDDSDCPLHRLGSRHAEGLTG